MVYLPCYCVVLVQTLVINIWNHIFVRVTVNCNLEAIIFYWGFHNPRMLENPIVNILWTGSFILVWPSYLEMIACDAMPALNNISFYLALSNLLTAVFV